MAKNKINERISVKFFCKFKIFIYLNLVKVQSKESDTK